jgi:hypothetical protein
MRRAALIVALALGLGPAVGADGPYGSDGLPFLAEKAKLIVRAAPGTTADAKAGSARASVYRVKIDRTYRGDVKDGDDLTVVLTRAADVSAAKDLDGRLLFLDAPLTADQAKLYGVTADKAHPALGGRLGAVAVRDAGLRLVEDYLKAPAAERLTWAGKAIDSDAAFLQRSAVLEAEAHLAENREKAVDLLARAVRGEKVSVGVRSAAVSALAGSRSDRAAGILGDLARDKRVPDGLRARAVQALPAVPGGPALLDVFKAGDDPFLAEKAKEVLNATRIEKNGPPPADLTNRLRSDDFRKQQAAAVEVRRYTLSKDVVEAVAAAAADGKTDDGARLLLVETLGRVPKDVAEVAAAALGNLVRDTNRSAKARSAALLSLSRLDPAVGKPVLKGLSDLANKDLARLAAALAGP